MRLVDKWPLILVCLSLGGVSMAQEVEDVLIWGLYLDLEDHKARDAAAGLSNGGYVLRVDEFSEPPHFLLSPGVPDGITRLLRKRRRDGIRIHGFVNDPESCNEKTYSRDSMVRYKYIRNNFINQFAIQQYDDVPERIQRQGEDAVRKYLGQKNFLFRKYLKQKANPGDLGKFAWTALGVPINENWPVDEISFQFIKKRKQLATLRFDTIPGRGVKNLKAIQAGQCAPYNRRVEFRKLYGFGPDRFKPLKYIPRSSKRSTKRFEIHFGKNESSYDPAGIREITDYLNDENLTIQLARVEGYASVEGSLENNTLLQNKRARVLIDILQRHNDEEIMLDTVITRETWDLFRRQIKQTRFSWLDTLSDSQIKNRLENEKLADDLEPVLSKGRKAILTLVLSSKLSDQEKSDVMFRDLQASRYLLCNPEKQTYKMDFRARIYGILNYMESAVSRGLVSKEVILNRIENDPVIMELLFYKAYKDFTEDRESDLYDRREVVLDAQRMYSDFLISSNNAKGSIECIPNESSFLNQLTDVHDLVSLLSGSSVRLDELSYPDSHLFYPIILHHLQVSTGIASMSLAGDARDLDKVTFEPGAVDPAYYFLLKKILIDGEDDILQYVYRSDELLEFDLWWLLSYSVKNWDPRVGYIDDEIDRYMMNVQINRLSRLKKYLCDWQFDQLKIDYHLKVLHGYLRTGMPEERDQTLMTQSFSYLQRYFIKNAQFLDEESALSIAGQYILIDNLYVTRTGSKAAYELLKNVSSRIFFSREGQILQLRLAYYHDPGFISLVSGWKDDNWCELFRGKYSLIPYGTLISKVCQECQ